jgi:hypothetical protein
MSAALQIQLSSSRFPTSKRDYEIITPMMKEVWDIVSEEIERMSTGVALYGPSRIGKSRTLRYVMAQIRHHFPAVLCVHASMASRKNGSDTRFFKYLIDDFNLDVSRDGDGDDLRSAIVQTFLIRCSETHDPRIIIVLDEAQRIKPSEYSYLIDLTNHIEKYGMCSTVILTGQPELMTSRTDLIKQRRRDAIGRFLENPLEMGGVSTYDDLDAILRQFDDAAAMQFPQDSGICITAAYLPDHYRAGFRVSNSATVFWKALEESAKQINVAPVVGMQNLTKALESALSLLSLESNTASAESLGWWKNVLQESGFLKHLLMMDDYRTPDE